MHARFDRRPLHAVLHSVAYASPQAMRGPFLHTTRADFAEAHALSSYSLVALAREALPFMAARRGGGSGEVGDGGGGAGGGGLSLPLPPPPPPEEGEGADDDGGGAIIALSYLGSSRVSDE